MMEGPQDPYIHLDSEYWDDSSFDPQLPNWMSGGTHAPHLTAQAVQNPAETVAPHIAANDHAGFSEADSHLHDLAPGVDLGLYVPDLVRPHNLYEAMSMADLALPVDLAYTPWASTASSEFGCTDSSARREALYQSPNTPMEWSPQGFPDTLPAPAFDNMLEFVPNFSFHGTYMANATKAVPGFFLDQPTISTFIGMDANLEAPVTIPTFGAQRILSKPAITPQQATTENRPPGMSTRKWRYITKPEQCPACPMRFGYSTDLKKHIAARHASIAAEHDVSTERLECKWCSKTFKRKDHLTRHLTRQHGREKKRNRVLGLGGD